MDRERARSPLLVVGAMALAALGWAGPLSGQDDVALRGRAHGVVPPASYFETLRRDPTAFRFSRAWQRRNPRLLVRERPGGGAAPPEVSLRDTPGAESPGEGVGGGGRTGVLPAPGTARVLGPRSAAVEGDFAFPLVLGRFADDPAPPAYGAATIQREYFDGPSSRVATLSQVYDELSGGRVRLMGETFDWVGTGLTRAQVAGGVSGLGPPSRVGDFIVQVLEALDDGTVDWGRYDNDGPDGVPNSGDDDGFVDVLAVLHPTAGAECGGDRNTIWSHRWTLWAATGRPDGYRTRSPSASGGVIRVNDYTIQPLLGCPDGGGARLNEVGVFAHELGHGFGLPDLYCTGSACAAAGIGEWGLMGSGAWGCNGGEPERPCHMSAWSKAALGWAQVETVAPGADLDPVTLPPVVAGGRVLRVDIPGTDEYYLLENRQPVGLDASLPAPGLLVWHVDGSVVEEGWAQNQVNAVPGAFGVRLVQADGADDLDANIGGNRGDSGDPFPGLMGVRDLHAGTEPAARARDGVAAGMTLLGLETSGPDLRFRLLTRFQTVGLQAQGVTTPAPLFGADGAPLAEPAPVLWVAPFDRVEVEAAPGEALAPGVRRPFQAWTDGVGSRRREVRVGLRDTVLAAVYQGEELALQVSLEGGAWGVAPGRIESDPASEDLWFPQGTAVTLRAVPTQGFRFLDWSGALAGGPNPVGLILDAPVQAGARFELAFRADDAGTLTVAAGDAVEVPLEAVNGSDPLTWTVVSGTLPPGLVLDAGGRISGSPVEVGTFAATLRAVDGLGLQGESDLTVRVGFPDLPPSLLAGPLLETGAGPTPGQIAFLDRAGNGNGRYDVGDVRSFLRSVAEEGALRLAPQSAEATRPLRLLGVGPGGSDAPEAQGLDRGGGAP